MPLLRSSLFLQAQFCRVRCERSPFRADRDLLRTGGGVGIIEEKAEVITINENINWAKVKSAYVAGGISQKKVAERFGIPWSTLQKRAAKEGWTKSREKAREKAVQKTVQINAEKIADNATIAADIKRKGLELLNRLFDDFNQYTATEHRAYDDARNLTDIKRLRDLTAAYKDLTGDIQSTDNGASALLQSLFDLERGAKHD